MDEQNVRPVSNTLDDAYTVEEIAKKLKMKERSAYQFCSTTSEFIVKRVGPRLLRINKQSFDDWWNARA